MRASSYIEPRAAWKVTLAGEDLTVKMSPRLISLRLSERRGEEADELEIVLHDTDGSVAPPPEGAVLAVALGWDRGTGVTPGLIDKGTFTVDEVSWDGPPDKVTIRARSADLKADFRTRKNKVWKDTTLGAVLDEIAGNHGLAARCHPDLSARAITAAEQGNKSDMQFLRDLGRRYDATATVKGGALIFSPIGAATTATGAVLPGAVIPRTDCSSASWKRAAREKAQDGAEAQYHDPDAAERKTVKKGGSNPRRLKRVYASEGDASAAATSETGRLKRAAASLDLTLALGNPALSPGMKITATGFKREIDAVTWLIASADHSMGAGGLKTSLQLEVAG